MARPAAFLTGILALGVFIFIGAGLAAIFSMLEFFKTVSHGQYVQSSDCVDGNGCTADLLQTQHGFCYNPPLSRSNKCQSNCYVNGTSTSCDGHGSCTSANQSACKGYCPANGFLYDFGCDAALFPLKPYFSQPLVIEDKIYAAGLGAVQCIAQVCTRVFMQIQATSYNLNAGYPYDYHVATTTSCGQILDSRSTTVDTSCIVAQEIPLVHDFLHSVADDDYFDGDQFATNLTGRFCVYHYACAAQNASVFYDPVNLNSLATLSNNTNGKRAVLGTLVDALSPLQQHAYASVASSLPQLRKEWKKVVAYAASSLKTHK